MSESPAAQLRRYLAAMRSEGLSWEIAWPEALRRLVIEEDVAVWVLLIERHAGAWREAYCAPSFDAVAVAVAAACDRIAQEQNRIPQAN